MTAPGPQLKRLRKSPPYDPFCFECHLPIAEERDLVCGKCHSSCHQSCAEGWVGDSECAFCHRKQSDHISFFIYGTKETFEHILRVLRQKYHKCSDKIAFNENIFQRVDLTEMDRRNKQSLYKTCSLFEFDVKTIVHNIAIVHSKQSQLYGQAQAMQALVEQQMQDIDTCIDCFMLAYNYRQRNHILRSCNSPHGVVWAPEDNFGYWPAKVYQFLDDYYEVRYFTFDLERNISRNYFTADRLLRYSRNPPPTAPASATDHATMLRLDIARLKVEAYFNEVNAYFNTCNVIDQHSSPFCPKRDLFLQTSARVENLVKPLINSKSKLFVDFDFRYHKLNRQASITAGIVGGLEAVPVSSHFRAFFNRAMAEHNSIVAHEKASIDKQMDPEKKCRQMCYLSLYSGMFRQLISEMYNIEQTGQKKEARLARNTWCIHCLNKIAVLQCCELGTFCSRSCQVASNDAHLNYCTKQHFD